MNFIDTETFNATPITHGTYAYTSTCEPMIVTWAFGDGPVNCWDRTDGSPMPADLAYVLDDPTELWTAHFAMFDRNVLRYGLGINVDIERWRCSMTHALCHGLPGGLDILCAILGVPMDLRKHKDGRKLIHLFCKPQKDGTRYTSKTHPVQWAQFLDYAKADIPAMREVVRKLPAWNYSGTELAMYHLDQKINDRGIQIDIPFATAAIKAVEREKERLAKRTQELTDGAVESTMKRDQLLAHLLGAYGVDLPDLQMATLERRLNDPDLPLELRELISNRLAASSTSTSKYASAVRAAQSDGRVRGALQFAGAARTRRWAGRTVQPHNFARPDLSTEAIDFGIAAVVAGAEDLVVDDVMGLCRNACRGMIVAPPGRKLVIADLANIEGRKGAWFGGEAWKLQAFRDYDAGNGPDLYKVSYANAFKIAHQQVDKEQRQIGKVCLAEGTLVMVDSGWLPIEQVTPEHKLWDGESWVLHTGLLSQGVKSVVSLAALRITRDHLVLCGTQWKEASALKEESTYLLRALASGAARLPSQAIWWALWAALRSCSFVAIAGALSMAFLPTISAAAEVLAAPPVDSTRQGNGGGNTPKRCRRQSIVFDFFKDWLQRGSVALRLATPGGLTMGAGAFGCATNGSRTVSPSLSTFARCRDGITRLWKWTAETLTATTLPATFASSASELTCSLAELSNRFRKKSHASARRMPTYDLANAGPNKRFTVLTARGPMIVHNCELMLQYAGGVGAFITGAATYSIDLDAMADAAYDSIPFDVMAEAHDFWEWTVTQKRSTFGLSKRVFVVCDALKRLWRRAHPGIVALWTVLEDTARLAIENPGTTFDMTDHKLKFRRDGAWLRLRLPSGAVLCYPSPQVDGAGKISYMGMNQYTKQWQRIYTYGGKFLENVCQGSAGDVLKHGMQLWEAAGYETVLTVHDEGVTETPDTDDFNAADLSRIMATVPAWAEGLPLAAAGFETKRYRKGG